MNLYFRIVLILIAIAYLISPVDIIPDFLVPFLGFLDDGLIAVVIYYLIRYGTLPAFLLKKQKPFQSAYDQESYGFEAKDRNSSTSEKKENPEQSVPKSPYDILGIRPGASKEEITAAYKKAVKKYHPDKLSHLGEEFSSLANEKFLDIQRAYDVLMKL
ncbi:MAG: DnaJ domain-containing protein [Desulfobacula sp.]|nr:DnaJ domain-containing protein [Desulfobacula sp.]MDA8134651.1 DnaJ domain-containing protein [Desulfobacteraceae bacterium]